MRLPAARNELPFRLNGVRGAGSQGSCRDKDLYGQAEDACFAPTEFAVPVRARTGRERLEKAPVRRRS
jgi:hypothetical protein